MWGATDQAQIRPVDAVISIHAPRVGRDIWLDDINCNDPISIHAPRVGRDLKERYPDGFDSISIHAPRVGRDIWLDDINCNDPISIHAPRVGRDLKERYPDGFDSISIHAPRVGRDDVASYYPHQMTLFQSTRPVWGATANLTILPRQICTKGTKEFLLGRKTHGKKEK